MGRRVGTQGGTGTGPAPRAGVTDRLGARHGARRYGARGTTARLPSRRGLLLRDSAQTELS